MTVATRQPSAEAQTLFDRRAHALHEALMTLVVRVVRGGDRNAALNALARELAENMALADLLGRRRSVLWARARGAEFADQAGPDILPRVPFQEAIDDITSRLPVLAKSAEEVQAVYAAHGFTLAQAADLQVVQDVQAAIAEALRVGRGAFDASAIIQDLAGVTRQRAETILRNNVGNAYSAGMDRMLEDPDVRSVIVALRYTTAGDVDVRPNHRAMDGTVAPPEHPIWSQRTPPCGHNCRCGRDFLSREDVRRMGLMRTDGTVQPYIPHPSVGPDPGFGGRPSARMYLR